MRSFRGRQARRCRIDVARIAGLQIACPREGKGERSTPVAFHGPLRGKSRLCRGGSGNAGSCVGRIRHMRALRVARRGIVP